MKPSLFINAAVLILIALAAYIATLHLENHKPDIIVQPEAPVEKVQTGQTAPDFTFSATDGKTYPLSDFKGKIIILNFWASWCPPCIKEFPHFIKAAQTFKDDIIFIGVSSDLNENAMNKFLTKIEGDLKAPNILIALDADQNITKNLFQTYRLPETILIDQNQVMRTKIIGADWTYDDLSKQIETLL